MYISLCKIYYQYIYWREQILYHFILELMHLIIDNSRSKNLVLHTGATPDGEVSEVQPLPRGLLSLGHRGQTQR